MNKTQKEAMNTLIALLVLGVFLVIPKSIKEPILPFLLLICIAFMIWTEVVRRRREKNCVCVDERDNMIIRNASYTALITLVVLAFIAIRITKMVLGSDATIQVSNLNELWFLGLLIYFFIRSIAILVQYGRGGKDGKE